MSDQIYPLLSALQVSRSIDASPFRGSEPEQYISQIYARAFLPAEYIHGEASEEQYELAIVRLRRIHLSEWLCRDWTGTRQDVAKGLFDYFSHEMAQIFAATIAPYLGYRAWDSEEAMDMKMGAGGDPYFFEQDMLILDDFTFHLEEQTPLALMQVILEAAIDACKRDCGLIVTCESIQLPGFTQFFADLGFRRSKFDADILWRGPARNRLIELVRRYNTACEDLAPIEAVASAFR